MKLCRFGPVGREKPGLIDAEGRVRDLTQVIADLGPENLGPERMRQLAGLDLSWLPVVEKPERFGPPVTGTRQFIAVGLNYSDHAAESNMPIPEEPILFTKGVSCIQGPNDPVVIPRGSAKTDWEVELGVIIGTEASYVSEADALSHVAGYCVVNDVSERAYQLERGGTWDKGKACPTFGPIGPWLVTADEVGDPQNLAMWLDINDKRVQTGNTNTMIFGVAYLVSYISQFMKLLPGDIITTGTPPGVGFGQKPEPWYLRAGDRIDLGIEKLGAQAQSVIG
ncbi:MAG: fumarylacetoacetate hydrolase family protein [Asticcacaulis sp.]